MLAPPPNVLAATLSIFLAVLAVAVSTSAVAKDLKQNKQAPAVSATQMTDSKMDKVAASTFGGGANNEGRLGSGIDGVWW